MLGVIYNEIFLHWKNNVYDKKRKDKALSLAILLPVSFSFFSFIIISINKSFKK